jgi:hypothetical protein
MEGDVGFWILDLGEAGKKPRIARMALIRERGLK